MILLAEAASHNGSWLTDLGLFLGAFFVAVSSGTGGYFIHRRKARGERADESDHDRAIQDILQGKAPVWCMQKHLELEKQIEHDRVELEKRLDERHAYLSGALGSIQAGIDTIHRRIDQIVQSRP